MNLTRRRFNQGLLAATSLAGLSACIATNPATGRTSFTGLYSVEDDVKIGREEAPKLIRQFGGEYQNPKIKAYVQDIGRRLSAHTELSFPYEFTVLNSPIVNAFALPGGNVFISRGLLALSANEAEMAGVLAHELGHVNARHSAERLSKAMLAQIGVVALGVATGSQAITEIASHGAMAYIQGFSRDQEFEADMLGVRYMSRAGYEPEAMVTFLGTLREHSMLEAKMMGLGPGRVDEFNIMSTHPRTIDRVKASMEAAAVARPANPVVGEEEYLARIDGMLFGDDPSQGIAFGRRFVHPDLRFEFEVPEDFRIVNGQTSVISQHPEGAAIVFDMGQAKSSRSVADYLRGEWGAQARLSGLESFNVNGMEAATASTRGTSNNQMVDIRLLAIRGDGSDMFRFMFVTPPNQTAGLSEPLRRTTYSFRRLSREEAAKIHPMRLLVINARPGDKAANLARTLPFGAFNEENFRILNRIESGRELEPGRPIRVVAA